MLRQARLDAPGVLHHVIIRGIERRRKIFFDKLAKHLAMTGPGVGYAVSRGDMIDRQGLNVSLYRWSPPLKSKKRMND